MMRIGLIFTDFFSFLKESVKISPIRIIRVPILFDDFTEGYNLCYASLIFCRIIKTMRQTIKPTVITIKAI
jgi:hypothetical protein